MRALVIEHDPLSTPERVGAHLERRGVSLEELVVVPDVRHPEIGVTEFPDPGRHDLLVLMGSPWSVYDPRIRSWLDPELELIRRRLALGAPLLGICFGAQATSAALGGVVSPSRRPEYGWSYLDSFAAEVAPGPWFQFHHDEFTLPTEAVELARNGSGLQAFAVGRSLAVQFHPEISPELLDAWCRAGGSAELRGAGVDPAELLAETERRAVDSQQALETMLDWWLEDLAG